MERVRQLEEQSQHPHGSTNPAVELSPEDRRLLLGASVRLLGHLFVCGKPILQGDLIRVESLADDALERPTRPIFDGRRAGA
jgi:hypothetical protein